MPLLAAWPGVIPPRTGTRQMSTNLDLFPTCLKLAGVPLPDNHIIDGGDMLPPLLGAAALAHDTLLFYDTRKLVAVRRRHWKYYRSEPRLAAERAALLEPSEATMAANLRDWL